MGGAASCSPPPCLLFCTFSSRLEDRVFCSQPVDMIDGIFFMRKKHRSSLCSVYRAPVEVNGSMGVTQSCITRLNIYRCISFKSGKDISVASCSVFTQEVLTYHRVTQNIPFQYLTHNSNMSILRSTEEWQNIEWKNGASVVAPLRGVHRSPHWHLWECVICGQIIKQWFWCSMFWTNILVFCYSVNKQKVM